MPAWALPAAIAGYHLAGAEGFSMENFDRMVGDLEATASLLREQQNEIIQQRNKAQQEVTRLTNELNANNSKLTATLSLLKEFGRSAAKVRSVMEESADPMTWTKPKETPKHEAMVEDEIKEAIIR